MVLNSATKDDNVSAHNDRDIFDKMKAGEVIRLTDPQFPMVSEVVTRAQALTVQLNASTHIDQVRERLSEITGSPMAKALIDMGHHVVLHARSAERGKQAWEKVPGAADVLIADLSGIEETKALASKANDLGAFDAVIHNAGVYQAARNSAGADGLPVLFAVNSLAPYILTCLMHKPKRLIYLSSGMHLQGNPDLGHLPIGSHNRNSHTTYSDTKLHDVILAMAVARKWTDVCANAVDPGWVPTRMGGAGAPDSLEKGFETQVWLAVSNDPDASMSGRYFHHKRQVHYLPAPKDAVVQEKYLALCEEISGVRFNESKSFWR